MKLYIIHFIKCFIGSKYLYISGMQPHRVTNELQNHNIAPLFRRKQIPEIPYNNVIKIIYLTFVSIPGGFILLCRPLLLLWMTILGSIQKSYHSNFALSAPLSHSIITFGSTPSLFITLVASHFKILCVLLHSWYLLSINFIY